MPRCVFCGFDCVRATSSFLSSPSITPHARVSPLPNPQLPHCFTEKPLVLLRDLQQLARVTDIALQWSMISDGSP